MGGRRTGATGETRAAHAIREALDPFAVTPIRDEIIRRALAEHGADVIPESGEALAAFVSGPLRNAIVSLFDRDVADAVVRTLGPVVGRAGRTRESGLRKRVTPGAESEPSRDRLVLCIGSDEETIAALKRHLVPVASVRSVDDTLLVAETVASMSPSNLRVVIDTRVTKMRAGLIGSIARQLPAGTRVMLWGVADAEARLIQVSRTDIDWLPVGDEAGPEDIATLCTVTGVSGARMRPSPRRRPILIVDHDAGERRALADALGALGYPVLTAASGAEALAMCAQRMPRLVLAEQELPGMSGVEMARLLHRVGGEETPPIVVLVSDVLEAADLADIDAAVPKAIAEERLEALIQKLAPLPPEPD